MTRYTRQVITVWSLDSAHQGLITHSAYNYLIRNYFNPAHLLILEKTLLVRFNGAFCQGNRFDDSVLLGYGSPKCTDLSNLPLYIRLKALFRRPSSVRSCRVSSFTERGDVSAHSIAWILWLADCLYSEQT